MQQSHGKSRRHEFCKRQRDSHADNAGEWRQGGEEKLSERAERDSHDADRKKTHAEETAVPSVVSRAARTDKAERTGDSTANFIKWIEEVLK